MKAKEHLPGHLVEGTFLRIIARAPNNKHHQRCWHTKCEYNNCGNKSIKVGSKMRSGHVKTCGNHFSKQMEGNVWSRNEDSQQTSWNRLFDSHAHNANDRNYENFLTQEQHKELCLQNCFYCGAPPERVFSAYCNKDGNLYESCKTKGVKEEYAQTTFIKTNGIDRLNDEPFYKSENSVCACAICNFAKRKHTYSTFMEFLSLSHEAIWRSLKDSSYFLDWTLEQIAEHVNKIKQYQALKHK